MENILSNISPEILFAIIALNFLFILSLFLMNISNRLRLKKLREKYTKFMNGLSDRNIEQLLDTCIDKVNSVSIKNKELENQINDLDRSILQCFQKIGVVRYNAFDNVGSDLSFAVALLDNNDNGIIISGIYSRESSSTYAKPLISGKSKYALSAEEIQAVDIARKSHRERYYTSNEKSNTL